MGFALVQSDTADMYAMRLAHNNALVSFRMQPNPDIPKDWNLIAFPINNRYVKQGTLDGRVGYDDKGVVVLDPDYSDAMGQGEHSYFKPREAYALKRRIQREEKILLNRFESMSKYGGLNDIARNALSGARDLVSKVDTDDGALAKHMPDVDVNKNKASSLPSKRNIVNTYVWTADGGFFAESTETSDVRTESTSGSFTIEGSITGSIGFEVDIFGAGMDLEMEASVCGGYTTSRTKEKEAEKNFSIEVGVDPPGDLQIYHPKPRGEGMDCVYDSDGNGINAAGKVDAYRFMTFYLDSDSRNFEDLFQKVIDSTWLAESNHPNALALRRANQSSKKPAC